MHSNADLPVHPAPSPAPDDAAPTEAVPVTAIAAIFERVLDFSPIEPDADFFELGGDSIMATALAIEIGSALGLKLPVSVLFDAPTPALLARAATRLGVQGNLMVGDRSPGGHCPGDRRLVLLKSGSGAPPVFLVPGAGGGLTEVRSIARQTDIASPVYSFHLPGLDGVAPPLARIEQSAEWFLSAVRALQPHGPYLLGGYSMGGLTAFELAQRLVAAGEEVALLALFDTYICPRRLSWPSKLAVWRRRVAHHAASVRGISPGAVPAFLLARCRSLLGDLGIFPRPSPGLPRPDDERLTPAMRRVIEASLAAAVAYRPRFYPGAITYFEARNNAMLPGYPELTWRLLARKFTLHVVDGDHWGMMRGRSADAARQFSASVRAALVANGVARPASAPIGATFETPGRFRTRSLPMLEGFHP